MSLGMADRSVWWPLVKWLPRDHPKQVANGNEQQRRARVGWASAAHRGPRDKQVTVSNNDVQEEVQNETKIRIPLGLAVMMLTVVGGIGATSAAGADPAPPVAPPWFTNGNAFTNPTTDFLGTT